MAAEQIVLILQRSGAEVEIVKETSLDLITLPHPKGTPVIYIQISGNILELQSVVLKKHASWFINQRVSSSSSFYMASKLDPRFLCLPYFEKAGARYSPLDQIITHTEGCARFPLTNCNEWKLEEIADVKDLGDDLILFRYSEIKTMDWLNQKVKKTALNFMQLRCSKTPAINTTFVGTFVSSAQSSKPTAGGTSASIIPEPEQIDIKMALQVVSDYLTDSMTGKLLKMLGLSIADLADTKSQNVKRKTDWEADLEVSTSLNNCRNCHRYVIRKPIDNFILIFAIALQIEEEHSAYINAQKVPPRVPQGISAPSRAPSKPMVAAAPTAAKVTPLHTLLFSPNKTVYS